MKNLPTVLISLCLLLTGASHEIVFASDQTTKTSVITSLTSMPLAFTENQGQWDEQVLFRANAGGATMWFTKDGAYYQFTRRISSTNGENPPQGVGHPGVGNGKGSGTPPLAVGSRGQIPVGQDPRGPDIPSQVTLSGVEGRLHQPDSIETMMIKADFVGSNPTPRVVGEGLLDYKCNYFLGNDPSKWRTDVPNHSAIIYEDIYPGIDLKYYGNGKQMEYDFIVSPGADPSQIAVRYEGAKSLSVDAAGRLVVETEWNTIVEHKPMVYQIDADGHLPVECEYNLLDNNLFGFNLTSGYDPELTLVIDPTLVYSTYLGGADHDWGHAIAVDTVGAAYVTGYTLSSDFPILNQYQADQGSGDVFVTKMSSAGNSLVYSTYLGGSGADHGNGVSVDNAGCAYVTGYTSSTDFPVLNPYQTDQGSYDVFVTKLASAGNNLVYSTYLGGGSSDVGYRVAVDNGGSAYVTGYTESSNFPTLNPYQTDQNLLDVFVTKLSTVGNNLIYSTYLGGNDHDYGYDIAVDSVGCAYVTGFTDSPDFPTVNPYQTDQGTTDAFVTKLSSAGNSLVYSTYLGGDFVDAGYSIAIDNSGCTYVTGTTLSSDFPTVNPYQTDQGGSDVFVSKLSLTGNNLVYSTYLGGNDGDVGRGIAVDAFGAAYVTGNTFSTDFPTVNPHQTDQSDVDGFLATLSSVGDSLVYSTYLGGNIRDNGLDIVVDKRGCAYATGSTESSDFLTVNPYQTHQGGNDAFVTKLCVTGSCCNSDGIRGDVNYDGSLNVADLTSLVDYLFRGGSAPPCFEEGDVNGDGNINIADLTYLVDYLFRGGGPPLPCP